MRSHHVVAVVLALVIGVGVKWFFFPAKPAEAQLSSAPPLATMNMLEIHIEHPNMKDMPVTDVKDFY
jgi:hypothetical protein